MNTPLTKQALAKLPTNKTFGWLLLPFFGPYFIYTLLASLFPHPETHATLLQGLKLACTGIALVLAWKYYRFGAFRMRDVGVALVATPIATLLWVGPLAMEHVWRGLPLFSSCSVSSSTFTLHLINSVLLVALFEELSMRVYAMEWAFHANATRRERGFLTSLISSLDEKPTADGGLPLNWVSFLFATLLFTVGHTCAEYPSAILYFGWTLWIYRRTRSLWACILIHAWTNLSIALLVRLGGMTFLW